MLDGRTGTTSRPEWGHFERWSTSSSPESTGCRPSRRSRCSQQEETQPPAKNPASQHGQIKHRRRKRSLAVETERAVMERHRRARRWVKSWLRSLLDLTFSNPLLRMGGAAGNRGVYRFELPDGLLGTIEDRLMGAGSVEVRLATQAPAALLRDPADVTGLTAELTDSGRLYSPDLVSYENDTARLRTQVAQTEPSFPPAQVAKVTADFLADQYGKELDRLLGALRRKAREIETQTGARHALPHDRHDGVDRDWDSSRSQHLQPRTGTALLDPSAAVGQGNDRLQDHR